MNEWDLLFIESSLEGVAVGFTSESYDQHGEQIEAAATRHGFKKLEVSSIGEYTHTFAQIH